MIAAGYYWAAPLSGKLTTTQTGTMQFAIEFKLLDTDDRRTVFLFTTDAAWPYTEEKLRKLGWNGNADDMAFTADRIELVCKHEQYNGKTREKWDVARDQAEMPVAPEDAKREVLARWKAGAGAKSASARKPDAVPARASTAPAQSAPPRGRATPATPKTREPAKDENTAWEIFFRQAKGVKASREQADIEKEFDEKIAEVAKGRDKSVLTPEEWTEIANGGLPF